MPPPRGVVMGGIKTLLGERHYPYSPPHRTEKSAEELRAFREQIVKDNQERREQAEKFAVQQEAERASWERLFTENLIDEALVLMKPVEADQKVTKHFCLVDGIVTETEGYGHPTWYTYRTHKIKSFEDIVTILDSVKGEILTPGTVYRGTKKRMVEKETKIRRTTDNACGLYDYKRQVAIFDFDNLCCIPGLPDPTKSPQAAEKCIKKIMSYTPPAFRDASKVVRFSSSTGLAAAKVGIHVFVFFDRPLNQRAVKGIQIGIDGFMKRRLAVEGAIIPLTAEANEKKICDPAVSNRNQPIYISPPVLGPGVTAPFYFRERRRFLPGMGQVISTDALLGELAQDDELHAPPGKSISRPPREPGLARASTNKQRLPGSPESQGLPVPMSSEASGYTASIIDLAFERSIRRPVKLADFLAAQTANGTAWSGDIIPYKKQCIEQWQCNVLSDAIRLIQARGRLTSRVNDTLVILTSLAVKKLALHEITEQRVRDIVGRIADQVFVDNAEIRAKRAHWLQTKKYSSIYSRAVDAARGHVITWAGQSNEDRRYGYSKSRVRNELIELLGAGTEELIRELRLSTLFDDADRSHWKRRDGQKQTAAEYRASLPTYRLEEEIMALYEQGFSKRVIAKKLTNSGSTVSEITVRRTIERVRQVRPTTVKVVAREAEGFSIKDSKHIDASNSKIVKTAPCLKFYDLPMTTVHYNNVFDLYVRPQDTNIPKSHYQTGEIPMNVTKDTNDNPSTVRSTVVVLPVAPALSKREQIDNLALDEPRLENDTSVSWSRRVMEKLLAAGVSWRDASDAVMRLWNSYTQPPLYAEEAKQSKVA